MSAVLSHEHIQPVIDDLELLKDIRRAIAELKDCELEPRDRVCITVSTSEGAKDRPICFVHGGSQWLAHVALAAMEREVAGRLKSKDIEVEPA